MIHWKNPKTENPSHGCWLCIVKAHPKIFSCDLMFVTFSSKKLETGELIEEWSHSGVLAWTDIPKELDQSPEEFVLENFKNSEWDERIRDTKGMTGEKSREILGDMIQPWNTLAAGFEINLISFFRKQDSTPNDIVLSIDGDLTMKQLDALNWHVQNYYVKE